MAKITDPTDLTRNTEVIIDPTVSPPKIGLEIAGNLTTDGVSLQALYSFCKEQWKSQADLIKYPFPMVAITPEQFEFQDDWVPSGTSTIELFRDAGFAVVSAGSSTEEYIGVITLGDVGSAQVYYQQSSDTGETGYAAADFVLTGAVNQAVKVYGDADNGDFDYRDYFKVFAREEGKIYDQADHTDIGVTTFTYQAYRFPLANSDDLKITYSDAVVAAGTSGHANVDITYYDVGQARTIGSNTYYFDKIIEGDDKSTEIIYEKIQYLLRQSTDIDEGAGIVTGDTADLLLEFVGDTLVTKTGVYIDNFNAADTNSIEFYETGGTKQTFPYVAAGSISFNDNLYGDADSIYRMFFTDDNDGDDSGADFGTANATLVRSNDKIESKTDISFSAGTNTIHSTSTNFATAGISVNTMIEVWGTASQATNDPWFVTVTGVSANQLDLEDTVADEAAGSSIDIYEIIGGNISGATSASFSYDYDNNVQRGNASSGTTAPVTVVAIGLDGAQYVKSTGSIAQSNANTISLVAALERNYSNP